MTGTKWQDHHLTDIIEAQFLLFCHLSSVLDQAGIVPRRLSAQALREIAGQDALRPGVRSCLDAIAELLEQAEARDARHAWESRVVPGGAESGAAGAAAGTGNGQYGNGKSGNGSLPAAWRPTIVGDDDPDGA